MSACNVMNYFKFIIGLNTQTYDKNHRVQTVFGPGLSSFVAIWQQAWIDWYPIYNVFDKITLCFVVNVFRLLWYAWKFPPKNLLTKSRRRTLLGQFSEWKIALINVEKSYASQQPRYAKFHDKRGLLFSLYSCILKKWRSESELRFDIC